MRFGFCLRLQIEYAHLAWCNLSAAAAVFAAVYWRGKLGAQSVWVEFGVAPLVLSCASYEVTGPLEGDAEFAQLWFA